MSNNYFKFKKFTINQDGCAMKVGTDGCLLGAWFDTSESKKILDVGAGTGLLSIMAAQRCEAFVTGIEIEKNAAEKAIENVKNSPWSDRVEILNCDINLYNPQERFDTIISNPPFFTNSLKSQDESRNLARHNDTLPPAQFFSCALRLLTEKGKISLIIPSDSLAEWQDEALFKGFSAHRITHIHTTPRKQSKRVLIEFRRGANCTPFIEKIILETSPGTYSPEAEKLLKDFYLKI